MATIDEVVRKRWEREVGRWKTIKIFLNKIEHCSLLENNQTGKWEKIANDILTLIYK